MRYLAACGLAFLLSSGVFAQRVNNGYNTNNGFGNVLFPAGKPVPAQQGRQGVHGSGAVVNGRGSHNGTGVIYVPYAYPYFVGGYYGYGNGGGDVPPAQPPQNITIIYPPAQQPMQPPMMMGMPPAPPPDVPRSSIQEYVQPQQQPPEAETTSTPDPTYYLLAFKDHSIYSAVGYWVDGDTLHYITNGNVHNQVSVSLVDRDLTSQLNRGRGVQVVLPPSR